eukprot:1351391-Amorphochlora_amoeboformis.AAC.2
MQFREDMLAFGYDDKVIEAAIGTLGLKDPPQEEEEAVQEGPENDSSMELESSSPPGVTGTRDDPVENGGPSPSAVELAGYQNLKCFKCSANFPGEMTICVSRAKDALSRCDNYSRDGWVIALLISLSLCLCLSLSLGLSLSLSLSLSLTRPTLS